MVFTAQHPFHRHRTSNSTSKNFGARTQFACNVTVPLHHERERKLGHESAGHVIMNDEEGIMRTQMKRMIPKPLQAVVRPIFFWMYRRGIRFQCWYMDRRDAHHHGDGLPVPPAILRFRVGETPSIDIFLEVGKNTARAIQGALDGTGKSIAEFHSILDFGCGCGRTLMWMADGLPDKILHGTDIDEPSIRWCRTHFPSAAFTVNALLPPTTFEDSTFDLIYAISVLTHLDEECQRSWLSELHRIMQPGGRLLLSVHGKDSWQRLSQHDLQILQEEGFLFKTSSKLHGILPDWYHTAYHSREYVLRTVSSSFRVLAYIEGGLGYQDLIVLER